MKKLTLFFAIIVLGVCSVIAQENKNKDEHMGGQKMETALTGAAEIPGPGDTDGSGTALVTLNQGKNQVCYELMVMNIGVATAAHIHEGATGVAGPAVVTLTAPGADGRSNGCVDVTGDLIKKIKQTPENFYVNVHNAEFADGAVRGQLGKKMDKPKADPKTSEKPN